MTERDDFQRFRSKLADRYTIAEEVGRGGMAVVYRALDLKHDREVAIKVLEPHFGVTLGAQRFLREITIEARLNHPHILAVFDSGQIDEYLYFVMPVADGGSLRDRLARERQLGIEEALAIVRDIGGGLTHAHRAGIVHRDVKPGNILFSAGHALVADFGLARAMADVGWDRLTASGVSLGTPLYMSPEQAAGQSEIDERSDVYSLGCVLFEMLAGDPPFTGANERIVIARHLTERPPAIEVARPDVPPEVAAAIGKALAKAPADRHRTVQAFIEALDRGTTSVRTRRWSRWRRRWRIAGVAAAMMLLLAIGWWLVYYDADRLSHDKVAVFPLATRGLSLADSLDGAGVHYLIETALEQAGPLQMIDVTGRLSERQQANPALITSADARGISAGLGAAYYLTGVVQGRRDSTTVILRLHEVSGDSVIRQRSATGATGVPLHRLGIDALLGLLPSLIDPAIEVDLSHLRNRKASAVALWWQGERAYRHSSFPRALSLYERALAEDSALAIAAIKGAQAAEWIHDLPRGKAMVESALSREALLPHRYVVFARGLRDYFNGAADSAAHWFGQANTSYPGWWESSAALGEVYHHMLPNAADGPLDSLARVSFERGLATDSFSPPLFHLIEIHIRTGEPARAARLLERFRAADPDPALVQQLMMMQECVARPRAMHWDAYATRASVEVLVAGKSLAVAGLQHVCAEGAFRAILRSPTADPQEHWGAFMGLQGILIATGRDLEARTLIDSVSATKGLARSLYVLGTVAGARMAEPAAQLESFARERFGVTYEGVKNTESLWVLSVWLQHVRNHDQLQRANHLILARGDSATASPRDRFFAGAIAARNILQQDTARTVQLLATLPFTEPAALTWGFGDALAPERLMLARLLLSQGRYRQSIIAASVFDHPEPIIFLQYLPSSLAIRYQAALALGDKVAAEKFRARLQRLGRLELLASLPEPRR